MTTKSFKIKYKIKVLHDYVDIESNYSGKIEKIHLPTGMLGFLFEHIKAYGSLSYDKQKHYKKSLGSYGDSFEFEVIMHGINGSDLSLHNKYKFDKESSKIEWIKPYKKG